MKYLLTLTLIIIGIFFIVIGFTAPSTLATVTGTNITGSLSTVPAHSNIPTLIDISIGAIFLIGAVFTGRRRL